MQEELRHREVMLLPEQGYSPMEEGRGGDDFIFCLLFLVSQHIVITTGVVFFTGSHEASCGISVV